MSLLINREVYFSDPSHFNDPYDCQISLLDAVNAAVEHAETVTKKGVKDKLSKLKGLNHIFEKMESDLKNLGIFSLSRTCENVLMWSHYAEDHKGFCLGFKLSDKFHTWNEHDKVIGCHDVIYTKSNPFLNYFIDSAKSEKASKCDDFRMSLTLIGLLSKSKAWEYEKEVRVFRRIPGMVSFSPTDLVEVVFGLNMRVS